MLRRLLVTWDNVIGYLPQSCALGTGLGFALAFQLIPEWGIEGMTTVVPVGQVVFIIGVAYIASLITTFLPAYQAARIYPAEALRYE